MIATKSKRLIVVGNWPCSTDNWIRLEDSYGMTGDEFFGVKKLQEIDNARVIDSFEYIVRPFRCRYFGKKTGRQTTIQYSFWAYDGWNPRLRGLCKFGVTPNNKDHTLFSGALGFRIGIPDISHNQIGRKDYDMESHFNYASFGYRKYMSSGQMSDAYSLGSGCNEMWIHVSNFYHFCFRLKSLKQIKEANVIGLFKEIVNYWSEKYNLNIKFLSVDDYLEILSWYKGFHMSDIEAYEYICDMKWFDSKSFSHYAKMMKEQSEGRVKIKSRRNWFNRGFEALMVALKDDRFKQYEIYFYGMHGIGLMKSKTGEFLTEYLALTELIDKKKVFYLPEKINSLKEQYVESVSKNLWHMFR